jgi:hypothetical protein
MENYNVELNEWWELVEIEFKEECKKNSLCIGRMRKHVEDIYLPSRNLFQPLYIVV